MMRGRRYLLLPRIYLLTQGCGEWAFETLRQAKLYGDQNGPVRWRATGHGHYEVIDDPNVTIVRVRFFPRQKAPRNRCSDCPRRDDGRCWGCGQREWCDGGCPECRGQKHRKAQGVPTC